MTTNAELPGWFLEVIAEAVEAMVEAEEKAALDDKDGGLLPMTGKTAVRRRQEVLAAERQSVMRAQGEALGRALQWTGCWGG